MTEVLVTLICICINNQNLLDSLKNQCTVFITLSNQFSTRLDPVPSPTCPLVVSTSLVYLFPTHFSVSIPLPLCSPAMLVLPLLLPRLHPLSLPSVPCSPVKMLSLQPLWWSSIFIFQPLFLHLCPSFHPTLWHPKWLRFLSVSFLSFSNR